MDIRESPLHVERSVRGRTVVVTVVGEVDANTAPPLHDGFGDALALVAPGGTLVVDLRDTTFFAAAGVTALVRLHKATGAAGVSLRLVATRRILRVLRISGTLVMFTPLSVPSPRSPG
ncbi:hypothetical protein GCM10022243_02610 [Saccharothrix violaceirubra]|uniref:Anti-anti-sigma factor n=1 Tax=Saccharothrix violaceirubra TaxID=413306 RepID=A0A7W7WW45_9PSEU|nr:STAS domain-containing protein [Saccharothrix violaceirubra]MBB4966019.1 anti-anti-sigma factor [Saccharothrix violaceirubra]